MATKRSTNSRPSARRERAAPPEPLSQKDRVVQVRVSAACWDRIAAQAPRGGGLVGEEWISVVLGRYAEEASRGGVLHPPVAESVAAVEGARLRVLRREAGLTVRQVGLARGVSFSWVAGIETGRFDQPQHRAALAGFYATLLGPERAESVWGPLVGSHVPAGLSGALPPLPATPAATGASS